MTPDEHPRRHYLADGSSLYAPSPSLSSFGAASVMMFFSAPPASWSVPLRQSVRYRSTDLVVNIMCIRTFCDHINILHIFESFEVRLELLCHAWFEGPTLSSSALPRFLFPSFPPSSYLSRFLLPLLPHFLRLTSLPPTFSSTHLLFHHTVHPPCPLSIPVDRVAKQAAPRTSFGFDLRAYSSRTRCVSTTCSKNSNE